jgi:hypothetical protein
MRFENTICKLINKQVIPSIVQMNFGNIDELPVLSPVINTCSRNAGVRIKKSHLRQHAETFPDVPRTPGFCLR